MLCKRVIARLDVKPSIGVVKAVRYEGLRRVGDLQTLADRYAEQGADEFLLLDGTASLYGRAPDPAFTRQLKGGAVALSVMYSGGVRTLEDIRTLGRHGCIDGVALNTAAVERPALIKEIAEVFGSQYAALLLEVRRHGAGWEVYTKAGRQRTGRDAVEWAQEAVGLGAGQVLAVSIDQDGTHKGLDLDLLKTINDAVSVPVVISGGASDPVDVVRAFEAGASGVAIGAWLHAGGSIKEIKGVMAESGVEVRV